MGQVFKFNVQYFPVYIKSILVIWKFAFPPAMMAHGFKVLMGDHRQSWVSQSILLLAPFVRHLCSDRKVWPRQLSAWTGLWESALLEVFLSWRRELWGHLFYVKGCPFFIFHSTQLQKDHVNLYQLLLIKAFILKFKGSCAFFNCVLSLCIIWHI